MGNNTDVLQNPCYSKCFKGSKQLNRSVREAECSGDFLMNRMRLLYLAVLTKPNKMVFIPSKRHKYFSQKSIILQISGDKSHSNGIFSCSTYSLNRTITLPSVKIT